MTELNYGVIAVATIAQFIFSWIWYMPLFGKIWGKMHGFDQVAADKQKEMMAGMWKLLGLQLVFTIITTVVFAKLLGVINTDWSIYCVALMFWLGFILPTQAAAVMFGGAPEGWMTKKLVISTMASLICMEIIAIVFKLMM